MKNKIILVIVLTFLIPQITLAAWWNPLSWSIFKSIKKQEPKNEQVLEVKSNGTENEENSVANQSTEIEQLKQEIEELKKNQNTPTRNPASNQPTNTTSKPTITTPTQTTQNISPAKENTNLCGAITEEEKLLSKNLSESIKYFQHDLLPVFDSQVKTLDYTRQYDNLAKVKDSFFRAVDEFKNKDIARINSEYLDSNYVSEIKNTLADLADGYKEVWNEFQLNSIKLKNIDFYDSYDKNRAYEIIEEQYDLKNEKDKLILKSLNLWDLLPNKYKEARIKNSCL